MKTDSPTSAGDDHDAWLVGVDVCEIEDRGQGEIFRGQRVQFSLGLHAPEGLRRAAIPSHRRQARHAVNNAYDVVGIVTRLEGGVVIDFGVEAVVVHDHATQFRVGDWVEGRVVLELHVGEGDAIRIPNRVPIQSHPWHVEEVLRCRWDDAGALSDLEAVAGTTVEDDAGEGYYILRCHQEH